MKFNRAAVWVLFNGAAAYGLWLCYLGSETAQNIMVFMIWVLSVTTILASFDKRTALKMRARGRSAPREVDITYDLAFTAALAGLGWYFTATAYLLHIAALSYIYESEKLKEQQ